MLKNNNLVRNIKCLELLPFMNRVNIYYYHIVNSWKNWSINIKYNGIRIILEWKFIWIKLNKI